MGWLVNRGWCWRGRPWRTDNAVACAAAGTGACGVVALGDDAITIAGSGAGACWPSPQPASDGTTPGDNGSSPSEGDGDGDDAAKASRHKGGVRKDGGDALR